MRSSTVCPLGHDLAKKSALERKHSDLYGSDLAFDPIAQDGIDCHIAYRERSPFVLYLVGGACPFAIRMLASDVLPIPLRARLDRHAVRAPCKLPDADDFARFEILQHHGVLMRRTCAEFSAHPPWHASRSWHSRKVVPSYFFSVFAGDRRQNSAAIVMRSIQCRTTQRVSSPMW